MATRKSKDAKSPATKGLRKAVPPADDPALRHGAHPPAAPGTGGAPAKGRAKASDRTAPKSRPAKRTKPGGAA